MTQLSNKIYCDSFIASLKYEELILASPYADYPYLIIKNFLSKEICEDIALHVKESSDVKEAKLISKDKTDNSAIRKTDIYTLSVTQQSLYDEALALHVKEIESFYGVALSTPSSPQLLVYNKGDYYKKHSDDSSELVDADKNIVGFKRVAVRRKITTLLFVNSEFDGGELTFNYLFDEESNPIVITPSRGDMIIFPSNPIFSHEVFEVQSGTRISIAQWHNISK